MPPKNLTFPVLGTLISMGMCAPVLYGIANNSISNLSGHRNASIEALWFNWFWTLDAICVIAALLALLSRTMHVAMSIVCLFTSSAAIFQFVMGALVSPNNVIGRFCLGCTSSDDSWSNAQKNWFCQPYLVYCFYSGSAVLVLCQFLIFIFVFKSRKNRLPVVSSAAVSPRRPAAYTRLVNEEDERL